MKSHQPRVRPSEERTTHHGVLQQVLHPRGRGGAVAAVFLFHVLLHFLHLVLSVFHIGKELRGKEVKAGETSLRSRGFAALRCHSFSGSTW